MKAALLVFTLINFSAKAQLVNIEAKRIHSDSTRRVGELNADMRYTAVNQKTLTVFKSALLLQQKSKNYKSYLLVLASAELSKTKAQEFENAGFLHIRYNQKMAKHIRWEVFTQLQSNLPIGVRQRWLAGTGPRFKLAATQTFAAYMGSLYMFEYEKAIAGVNTVAHRSSSYLSFSLEIPAIKTELVSTAYYQPLFANFKDYRILSENRLNFNITKKFKVQTSFKYFFDSRPPQGINNYTIAFDQGFGWKF
jgi:hypothetical protein